MSNTSTNFYLEKNSCKNQQIFETPQKDLNIIIVIPCYSEPHLIKSLESIKNCQRPARSVEVITVVNFSENDTNAIKEENRNTFLEAQSWCHRNSTEKLNFYTVEAFNLPKKHAGVGLARKIGMDEAVRRFEVNQNKNGIIVCFDADSLVTSNYLQEIEKHFVKNTKSVGCSIHFEHPLDGPLSPDHYLGIINYELHLRYYIHALQYSGHPHAFQTIGSSMAVKNYVYQKEGGMNRRKAGEDFYFLHKIIPLGNFTTITETFTIPSPRTSNRVPFGTGKAIGDYLKQTNLDKYYSYNFNSFKDLKRLIQRVPNWYKEENLQIEDLPETVKEFLISSSYQKHIALINQHSASLNTFLNRFYSWFNGLMVLKFIHFCRDQYFPDEEIKKCIFKWNDATGKIEANSKTEKKEILFQQRTIDQLMKNIT